MLVSPPKDNPVLVCPACRLPWCHRSVRQEGRQVTRSRISGDIAASDDHSHALGPERNFNESAYFNSLDEQHSQLGP
jgi:hypothetical protein